MQNNQLKNSEVYKERFIRFVDLFQVEDWTVKLYWISYKNENHNDEWVKFSLSVFKDRINSISNSLTHYNLGVGMIHEGKDGTYVIFSYWVEENMIDHLVYMIDPLSEKGYKRIEPNTIVSCVWELEVLYFEKQQWIEHMLKGRGNTNAYLSNTLTIDV